MIVYISCENNYIIDILALYLTHPLYKFLRYVMYKKFWTEKVIIDITNFVLGIVVP